MKTIIARLTSKKFVTLSTFAMSLLNENNGQPETIVWGQQNGRIGQTYIIPAEKFLDDDGNEYDLTKLRDLSRWLASEMIYQYLCDCYDTEEEVDLDSFVSEYGIDSILTAKEIEQASKRS